MIRVGGVEDQFPRAERGFNQRHAGQGALGKELALLIHHHEAPVSDETEGVDFGGSHRQAAQRFYGIEKQAADMHGV